MLRGPRAQFFTIQSDPKPVNNLIFFLPSCQRKKNHGKKTHVSVTVTVVRGKSVPG